MESLHHRPIESVGLPLRVSRILLQHHIDTVGCMLKHSKDELLAIPGFGKGSLKAVDEFVASNGLEWVIEHTARCDGETDDKGGESEIAEHDKVSTTLPPQNISKHRTIDGFLLGLYTSTCLLFIYHIFFSSECHVMLMLLDIWIISLGIPQLLSLVKTRKPGRQIHFIHHIDEKLKLAWDLITNPHKWKTTIVTVKLILTILLSAFVSIFYIQSYRVPVRKISVEVFDTTADSIILNQLTYRYPYGRMKHEASLLYRENILYNTDSCAIHDGKMDSIPSGMTPMPPMTPEEYVQSLWTKKRIPTLININMGHLSVKDSLKEIYSDRISYLEELEIDEKLLNSFEGTRKINGIALKQNIPHSLIPFKKYRSLSWFPIGLPEWFATSATTVSGKDDVLTIINCYLLPDPKKGEMTSTARNIAFTLGLTPILFAEDFSQTKFNIHISPLEELKLACDTLRIEFNNTVTLSEIYPTPSIIGSDFIQFNDRELTSIILESGLIFHTVNPEMSNIMLIKMFVLTALLTALIVRMFKYSRILAGDIVIGFVNTHKRALIKTVVFLCAVIIYLTIALLC